MRFAIRLATLGLVFILMFSVIGLRLWFVQVAQGPDFAEAAEELTWLTKTSPAPRGDIYDRNGTLLATSQAVPAVFIDRTFVDPEQSEELIQRVAAMVGIDPVELEKMYDDAGINGRFEVAAVSIETAYAITESLDELPGVELVSVPERVYLTGPTLAHVMGHLGLPSQADLDERQLDPNVRIGKLGVERSYDEYLQGTPGSVEYRVRDAEVVEQKPPIDPVPGDSLTLTIDLELQELVELALQKGVKLSNQVKDVERAAGDQVFSDTKRAAAVVLDVNTFEVLALASYPDFDPSWFVSGIDDDKFEDLTANFAFNNLAISGLYPPASTFKAITYTAIEEENLPFPEDIEGVDAPNRLVHCDGELILAQLTDGSQNIKKDWYNPQNLGWLDIHGALENSCNIYFWTLAMGTWQKFKETPKENVLQNWAKSVGYGALTGIDLGSEATGTVPTRQWMEERAEYQREHPDEPPLIEPDRLALASPWLGGDLLDFAIGQGAFTATPLQVAMSYAVLVNGGQVMEPRVVKDVVDPDGNVIFSPLSPVTRTVEISEATRRDLLTDLGRVVTTGTAATAFAGFGKGLDNIGGKTGTGQSSDTKDNHAWFVGVAPLDNPQYVVAVIIDEGGSGGRIAAPVGRQIMQFLMGNKPTPIVEGEEAQ